eukprot:6164690-Amphidinium_carterae.1
MVTYHDPHPADMIDLTQGAAMTPTVMLEGQWNTWSYGDMMVPEQLMSMLSRDADSHEWMTEEKRERKWHHVVKPLLSSLAFRVSKDGSEWNPPNGVTYYQDFNARLDNLQKKYREPDTSLPQWADYAIVGDHYVEGAGMCVPGRLEQYNQPSRHEVNDSTSGVKTAEARCLTFQLQGAIEVVDNWTEHVAYTEHAIERLDIWNRPRKTGDIEMVSTYVARTPFTFVKSVSTTRKNDELSDSQDSESKRRKVEEIVSLLDTTPGSGQNDVTMGTFSGKVLSLRGGERISGTGQLQRPKSRRQVLHQQLQQAA